MHAIEKENKNFYSPFVLVVLDGFGVAPSGPGNAVSIAKMPFWQTLLKKYPHTKLHAHGLAVGLFQGADGNSEAGHINLGAGRIVQQDLVAISKMIQDGTFFKNAALIQAVEHIKKNKSNIHLIGLLTGLNSAHSYPEHLDALLKFLRQRKVKQVYLHLFTDGRDSPPFEAYNLMHSLIGKLDAEREHIATIMGRFYGMDRKKEWERTQLAYDALIFGSKIKTEDPLYAIEESYASGRSDEFLKPVVVQEKDVIQPRINDNDAVIFFNSRSDRARQLTKAFIQLDFNKDAPNAFKRKKVLKNLLFVALADFGPDLPGILTVYPSPNLKATLPMELSDIRQLYIAETDKYGHMTYFFNGGYADPVGGENRILIKSPKVDLYDEKPEMSDGEITDLVIKNIRGRIYDFIAINFANPDMVGHTGNLTAAIKGLEFLDKCLHRIYDEVVVNKNGWLVITADHGNAEEMIDEATGKVDTQHSTFPVPFLVSGPACLTEKMKLKDSGILADVAPTILYLLKRDKPEEMTGNNLIAA
ncbi:MAG: 2,3-bisphosphoglycerate-independent phosphoglycerate mutase [Candidatus Kuenenbacteria bacterium]